MRAVLTPGLAAILLVGCGIGARAYDQRGGPAIAERIRLASSPIVQEVAYHPGDYMDAAMIDVILKSGVEADQAVAFICAVVLPAVASGDKPDSLGVDVLDDASKLVYSVDPRSSTVSRGGANEAVSCGP